MIRLIKSLIVICTASCIGLFGNATSAYAKEKTLPEHIQVIVDKAFAGRALTQSEKTLVVQGYPDLARIVPALATAQNTLATKSLPTNQVTPMSQRKCNIYTGWNSLKSLLGFTIYTFTHKATACSNGTVVTSHSYPTYTISEADITVDNWHVVDETVTGVYTSTSQSRLQIRLQQCIIKYSCYSTHYPTGTITARADNTAIINPTPR